MWVLCLRWKCTGWCGTRLNSRCLRRKCPTENRGLRFQNARRTSWWDVELASEGAGCVWPWLLRHGGFAPHTVGSQGPGQGQFQRMRTRNAEYGEQLPVQAEENILRGSTRFLKRVQPLWKRYSLGRSSSKLLRSFKRSDLAVQLRRLFQVLPNQLPLLRQNHCLQPGGVGILSEKQTCRDSWGL